MNINDYSNFNDQKKKNRLKFVDLNALLCDIRIL